MPQLKVKVNLSTICALAESESKPTFIRAYFTFAIEQACSELLMMNGDKCLQL